MNEQDLADLQAAMTDPDQTEEKLKMRVGKIVIGAALRTPVATMASHPEIIGPYHDMCRKSGIKYPPEVVISPDYYGPPVAITRDKAESLGLTNGPTILAGSMYDMFFDKDRKSETTQAMLAHETVHILANDSESSIPVERRADTGAAQLLGSREPVIALVEAYNSIPRFPHEEVQREELYGTPEDRLKNAQHTDLDDTAELKELISAYNARCEAEQKRQR